MAIEPTAEDKLAAQHLNGLLGYVAELIKLDERPATMLAQHKLADGSQFILHQHELAGLPGITFDISDPDGPIWVRMERLQRAIPPQVDEACRAWVDVSNDPTKPPVIREAQHLRVLEAEKDRMIEASEARPEDCVPSLKSAQKDETPGVFFDVMLRLEDRPSLREALEAYCAGPWAEWAEREKPRRRSIAIYQRLFEIAQRLRQSGGIESVELIWSRPEESIDLPIIERGGPERWADDMRRQRILERVGWTFWRCFGSNYSLDRGGVLDDLFQTLERMDIKPVGGTISGSRHPEHRVVKVKNDAGVTNDGEPKTRSELTAQSGQVDIPMPVTGEADDASLAAGDRIVIRYLDDLRSRPECYTLTESTSDRLNGLLSVSSPLAVALADASPGDEIAIRIGDRDRAVLYMYLVRKPRRAAPMG